MKKSLLFYSALIVIAIITQFAGEILSKQQDGIRVFGWESVFVVCMGLVASAAAMALTLFRSFSHALSKNKQMVSTGK